MRRLWRQAAAVAAASLLALSACGGAADDDTATDPVGSEESSSPDSSPTPEPEMIGDYPAYAHEDYTYDLEVQCFCPYFGQPVRVTVIGGEVSDAVWAKRSRDHAKGEEVTDEWLRLSIDDILRDAADRQNDKVEVDWAEGEDHPTKVFIDRMENATDDEVTYVIGHVQPA